MSMTLEKQLEDRKRWTVADRCSVAKVLTLLGTKTAFLVVRECFYGTVRFDDFVERVGASAPAVSRALRQLESAQIVSRVPYQEPGARIRDEYRLTEAGEDLLPVMLSLAQWGDAHVQDGNAPLSFVDADGEPVRVRVVAGDAEPGIRSGDIHVRGNFTLRS